MNGNFNSAVAMGFMMKLQRLEKEFKTRRLSKSEKETRLREIRELRNDLKLPDLPDYNSEEFRKWMGKPGDTDDG